MISIRAARSADAEILLHVFISSVRRIASKDYSSEQINAWLSSTVDKERWIQQRLKPSTRVAEIDSVVVGFTDLEADGHIDMMFVRGGFERHGIGAALLAHVEAEARDAAMPRLFTEASLTARPFFEARGFVILERETVERQGIPLDRFRMQKNLTQ